MSGHSKWATIKNKKGKTDATRGKIFTKMGRLLATAVRQGGGDPSLNSKLRDVIAKCKAANMPNDNITRSIKKYSSEGGGANFEEVVYEGYGVNGVALIVEALTDNRNRTAADLRHLFDKFGNGLGTTGCVSYMFDNKGVIVIEKTSSIDEDELMLRALDVGAEDFVAQDDAYEIYTELTAFSTVREALENAGYEFISADLSMIPQTTIEITDPDIVAKIQRLIDNLEDNDDVQNVYHNAILPDEEEDD